MVLAPLNIIKQMNLEKEAPEIQSKIYLLETSFLKCSGNGRCDISYCV